ncbi:thermosome subunit [Candidatus Bathyarchaeota archaeon]|nr:thermosome subunit [Candidatus Bathyarchaeota archaeon]MDP7443666.1 thermosome subunit beta [Candidatus Bathyarchaeota archaeon]
MAYLTRQPILILKEGTERSRGRDARKSNMTAAQVIAEVLKTTLGPRGMDKMLIDSLGDITITNDGATVLDEIDVQHPAAKMMIEVAKTQDDEVGDGTTTAVIFAGELLKKAQELLEQNIHPSIIIAGYQKASEKALVKLENLAIDVDLDDRETLMKLANTSMRSKTVSNVRDHLSGIVIDAILQIIEERNGEIIADVENVQIVKKEGKSLNETKLVKGIIIDKEAVHDGMPKKVENPKIALIDAAIEVEKTEFDAEIRIRSPDAIKAFLNQESEMLKAKVDYIVSSGAKILFAQKGIDDVAQHYLAKAGVLAARRVKKSDMEKLAKATGAKIVSNLSDLKDADLGSCEIVEERKVGDDKMIFVEGCDDPRAVAIFIRAGLERMIDEAERALNDALFVISDVAELPKMVPGGGAIEMELSKAVRSHATQIGGREQLAIEAFADALEVIPKTLAENAGLDILDSMVAIKAAHDKKGGSAMGVNVYDEGVIDMLEQGVVEPMAVKLQAVKSAVEVSSMILRIDDVVAATSPAGGMGGPGGPPGGMPDMDDM